MLSSPVRRLRAPLLAAVTCLAVVPLAAAASSSSSSSSDDRSAYAGDDGLVLRSALVGSLPTDAPIAGVLPGTAPWVLDEGSARLRGDGTLHLRVKRLVIPTAPSNGTNPVPTLSASVVCNGSVIATTPTTPFTPRGNARLVADIGDLPSPCAAPAVLVHPNAVTARYIAFNGSR